MNRKVLTAGLAGLVGFGQGCIGADLSGSEGGQEGIAAKVMAQLSFEGGQPVAGALPQTTKTQVELRPLASHVLVEPGDAHQFRIEVENPDDDSDPVMFSLIRVGDAPGYVEVPAEQRMPVSSGDASAPPRFRIDNMFTVSEGACDDLCAKVHAVPMTEVPKLRSGEIGQHAERTLLLDCRTDGDADACTDGDAMDDVSQAVIDSADRVGSVAGDGDAGDGDAGDGDAPIGDGDGDGDAPIGDGDGDGDGPTACAPYDAQKLDMLFVIDNSQSMGEEQRALRDQFPRLLQALTTGTLDRADGSTLTFPAVTDLHLGVVTTDMGVLDIPGLPSCYGFGDDGVLQNTPDPQGVGCDASYPRFLSYAQGGDATAAAGDLACIAGVGTEGCGMEQQLEAALKALWPSVDVDPSTGLQWVDPNTGMPSNRIRFLTDSEGNGGLGHGDLENDGFLRHGGPDEDPSMVAVVVLTDEEDCSSFDTAHFTPPQLLPDGDPLQEQAMNLRCFYNKQNLYAVYRYVNGLRALRPGAEGGVFFAAIAGVPADLVTSIHAGDGGANADTLRDEVYDAILDDDRMQERIDTSSGNPAAYNLTPSCSSENGVAYPPRRLTEVARLFGENGTIQSLCDGDLTPAVDAIVERIAARLETPSCP